MGVLKAGVKCISEMSLTMHESKRKGFLIKASPNGCLLQVKGFKALLRL